MAARTLTSVRLGRAAFVLVVLVSDAARLKAAEPCSALEYPELMSSVDRMKLQIRSKHTWISSMPRHQCAPSVILPYQAHAHANANAYSKFSKCLAILSMSW